MSASRKRTLAFVGPVFALMAVAGVCGGKADDTVPTAVATAARTLSAVTVLADAAVPASAGSTETGPSTAQAPLPVVVELLGKQRRAPELTEIASWINSEPFTLESQRGNVVLIDFWTYTCINCIRTLPYVREWHEKYADAGLVVVGVHTPEFKFEHLRENVVEAVGKFEIEYAVAQDNGYRTWRAFNNRYWPAKYLIDKDGFIRYTDFGEGAYDETEQAIRELLAETAADVDPITPNADS